MPVFGCAVGTGGGVPTDELVIGASGRDELVVVEAVAGVVLGVDSGATVVVDSVNVLEPTFFRRNEGGLTARSYEATQISSPVDVAHRRAGRHKRG